MVAGSEKTGIKTIGEKCGDETAKDRVRNNEVFAALHGIHVPPNLQINYEVRIFLLN